MIVIVEPPVRQSCAQELTEAPLHAIAHDSIADLLRYGDAIPHALSTIGASQQHKARPRVAQTFIGSKKIGALRKNGKGHQ